jgi:hypothetical protein
MGTTPERKCFYYGAAFWGRVSGILRCAHEAGRAEEMEDGGRQAERKWETFIRTIEQFRPDLNRPIRREFAFDLIPFTEKVKKECGADYTDVVMRIKKAVDEKRRWTVQIWDLTTELINMGEGL